MEDWADLEVMEVMAVEARAARLLASHRTRRAHQHVLEMQSLRAAEVRAVPAAATPVKRAKAPLFSSGRNAFWRDPADG